MDTSRPSDPQTPSVQIVPNDFFGLQTWGLVYLIVACTWAGVGVMMGLGGSQALPQPALWLCLAEIGAAVLLWVIGLHLFATAPLCIGGGARRLP